MHGSFEFVSILPNVIKEGVELVCWEREGCRPNQGAEDRLLIESMHSLQRCVADFEPINKLPAPSLSRLALNLEARSPASAAQCFICGSAPETHNFCAEKRSIHRQGDAEVLFKQSVGVKHKLLGKPLQIGLGIKLCQDLLAGPSPLGMELAATH